MSSSQCTAMPSTTHWVYQRYTDEQIGQELLGLGYSENQAAEILTAFRKTQREARSTRGFYLMVIGAVFGFISCVLTLTGTFPEYRDLIMVGLTTLAICIAVWGCYYVFE